MKLANKMTCLFHKNVSAFSKCVNFEKNISVLQTAEMTAWNSFDFVVLSSTYFVFSRPITKKRWSCEMCFQSKQTVNISHSPSIIRIYERIARQAQSRSIYEEGDCFLHFSLCSLPFSLWIDRVDGVKDSAVREEDEEENEEDPDRQSRHSSAVRMGKVPTFGHQIADSLALGFVLLRAFLYSLTLHRRLDRFPSTLNASLTSNFETLLNPVYSSNTR